MPVHRQAARKKGRFNCCPRTTNLRYSGVLSGVGRPHQNEFASCVTREVHLLQGFRQETSNFDDIYDLLNPIADDNHFAAMKALAYIYSNCGGFGYGCGILLRQQQLGQSRIRMFSFQRGMFSFQRGMFSFLEECSASKSATRKPLAMKAQKPDCGAKTDCADQKKAEDQNPT